jgi:two-component system chemotaxis response regulator CheY
MSKSDISLLSIILIEPSKTQQKIIAKQLNEIGVQHIDFASSGQEAFALMERYPPDLVISSLYLPDMTATELLTNIRENNIPEDLNFLLISSETSFDILDPIKQAGVVDIIHKPFEPADLKQAVITTLDYLETEELIFDNYDVTDLKLLLVDDSTMAQKHVSRLLRGMGFKNIEVANNGQEASEKLDQQNFDLILTDLNMPIMDGQQFVEHVRNERGNAFTPIIMITSEIDEERLQDIQNTGVSAIFDKPFDPAALKSFLTHAIE